MVKKNFGQKKFWIKKIESKIFWVIKILGQKIFWVKNFWDEKNFGQKDLDPKFFCLKKQVGLTQGGGYMNPPQKIVGLKLCWIVVSFAW